MKFGAADKIAAGTHSTEKSAQSELIQRIELKPQQGMGAVCSCANSTLHSHVVPWLTFVLFISASELRQLKYTVFSVL